MTITKLTLKTEGDTHIVVTRSFAAPPEAVYRASTWVRRDSRVLLVHADLAANHISSAVLRHAVPSAVVGLNSVSADLNGLRIYAGSFSRNYMRHFCA